jgi:hypothetical protein
MKNNYVEVTFRISHKEKLSGDVFLSLGIPPTYERKNEWILRSNLDKYSSMEEQMESLIAILDPKNSKIQSMKKEGYNCLFNCRIVIKNYKELLEDDISLFLPYGYFSFSTKNFWHIHAYPFSADITTEDEKF